jgi:hypothetical protein
MTTVRTTAGLLTLLLLTAVRPTRAGGVPDFDDSIAGPRRQRSVVAPFAGDAAIAQPVNPASQAFRETRVPVTGSGWVTSVSGYCLLPAGEHLLKAQIVAGTTDPVRSEVLATLDYTLVAVTPDGCYYAVSLSGLPVRVPDLGAFSVFVLRDGAGPSTRAEMTAMLNVVQTSR